MTDLNQFLARAERLLERLEGLLPAEPTAPDWAAVREGFIWPAAVLFLMSRNRGAVSATQTR